MPLTLRVALPGRLVVAVGKGVAPRVQVISPQLGTVVATLEVPLTLINRAAASKGSMSGSSQSDAALPEVAITACRCECSGVRVCASL